MNALSFLLVLLVFPLSLSSLKASQDARFDAILESPQEPPVHYSAFFTDHRLVKLEIQPSLSSHLVKCTGIFNSDEQLISFTIETWNLLDDQAIHRLEQPKFESIHVYQFKAEKIVSRSKKEASLYVPEKNIQSLVAEIHRAAKKKLKKTQQK